MSCYHLARRKGALKREKMAHHPAVSSVSASPRATLAASAITAVDKLYTSRTLDEALCKRCYNIFAVESLVLAPCWALPALARIGRPYSSRNATTGRPKRHRPDMTRSEQPAEYVLTLPQCTQSSSVSSRERLSYTHTIRPLRYP